MPAAHIATGNAPKGEDLYGPIARKIREGACVLFLGPSALTIKQPDGSWKPLTDLCARYLAERYGLDLAPPEVDSLPHVASTLRVNNQMTADLQLQEEVKAFYKNLAEQNDLEFHPILEKLSEMPFKIVINTTPDDFFLHFYKAAFIPHRFDFYNFFKPGTDPNFDIEKDGRVLMYNLAGFYTHSESLVLTYKQQLEYVKKISLNQHERLPESLTIAFKDTPYYLFLGFDFDDWSLRLILDNLFKNVRGYMQPYAYPQKGKPTVEPSEKVFYRGEFGMQFPAEDMETFVNGLDAYLNQPAPDVAQAPVKPRAQVLVLHNDNADHAHFEAIQQLLRALNVHIWTLADALGEGDVQAWILRKLDAVQVVLPLLSPGFFDSSNPALALLEELARRNRPRKHFLVMPVLLNPFPLDDNPLAALPTRRPLNNLPLFGEGKEQAHLQEMTTALRDYLNTLPNPV